MQLPPSPPELNTTPIRRRRIHRPQPKTREKPYRINKQIVSDPIRFIDEEKGTSEVVPLAHAVKIAIERELDLVEVSPKAEPPVVKVVDFGQFRYEQGKLERKSKAKAKRVEMKGVRLTLKMSKHDIEIRVAQATKFLEKGNKVKIDMLLRGREQAHIDLAKKMIRDFVEAIELTTKLDEDIKRQGGRLSATIMRQ